MIDETARLRLIADYGVMDTGPDEVLDEIVALASAICQAPIALISLVDATRQQFKARVGLAVYETHRDHAFCAHAIARDEEGIFVVPDARKDPRFVGNPLVTEDPQIVFYAGAPLVVEGGAKLGTLCVIDREPRDLNAVQKQALATLSKAVVRRLQETKLEAERRRLRQLANEALAESKKSASDALEARDIVESARESADSERRRLYALFMQTPAVIAVLRGPEHVFDLANPTYKAMVGGREIVGRPIREALPELAAEGLSELLDGVYKTGEPFLADQVPVQVDRLGTGLTTTAHFNLAYQPLLGDRDRIEGVLVFGVEVTDQVRARKNLEAVAQQREALFDEQRVARDAAENANRTMDQFLATVSHELRTPLNAMLGWTRLLRMGQVAEAQREKALATVERNATAQLQLVGDLLDVSRIISGKMRIEAEPLELVSVLEAALDVVRPAAEAKGVQLLTLIDPAAGPVSGDGSRLQQVIWNLLSNAVKFTPKGGSVQIRLDAADGFVEISVVDTGEGIGADFLPHVFERFRQAEGAMSRAHGGLGLGLAIVKNIVELHGGTIRAESEGAGKGASLIVRLPALRDLTHRIQDRAAGAGHDDAKELEGLRILIVDDEADSRELLAMLLEQSGVAVTQASSAAAAMEAFTRERFAAVVSDIAMPGEDGYSLVKRLRALPVAKGGRVPVVALTAYARGEDRTRALRAGFNAHVAKPVETAELLAVVASVVRG